MVKIVENLKHYLRLYDSYTQVSVSTKNRLYAINPTWTKDDVKADPEIKAIESKKDSLMRIIKKLLDNFPVWKEWLADVDRVGGFVAGNIILLYYFKHIPICKGTKAKPCNGDLDENFKCTQCGRVAKGDGRTMHRIELRPGFDTISKWWKFMGIHIEDGKKPKREANKKINWSARGRNIMWHFSSSIPRNKQNLYTLFLEEMKAKHRTKHPVPEIIGGVKRYTDGHINNMGKHEASKLFAAHFWTVARHLDGLPVSYPYAHTILGHTNIIEPFYYKDAAKIQYTNIVPVTKYQQPVRKAASKKVKAV